jgi:glycosyltransferase involved in cell wall biosynthesis
MGGDLKNYLDVWNLKENIDYKTREETERYGLPQERLNELYRMSDMAISSAWGEGFGLLYLESQFVGIPVITGDVSVESELLPKEYLVKQAGEIYVPSGEDGTPYRRGYIKPEDLSQKMIEWFDLPDNEKQRIIKGRKEWAEKLEFSKLENIWQKTIL